MKEEVRKLWEICFEDNKAFVDLYFSRRYSDEINLAVEVGDSVVSALQMVPYQMTYDGSRLPVSYISGACTHPDFRSKGVMKELLCRALGRMFENQAAISTLIPAEPWLFGYYSKFGYIPAFFYERVCVPVKELQTSLTLEIAKFNAAQTDVFPYFDRKMKERNCAIQHSEEDFGLILADLYLSGGELFVASRRGRIAGLVFCLAEGETLMVFEWLADSGEVFEAVSYQVALMTGCDYLAYTKQSGYQTNPKGMVRIIEAEKILQCYARTHPGLDVTIKLSDAQIPQNNGLYRLAEGICGRLSSAALFEDIMELNISRLAGMFFENEQASMSLMLD